MSEADEVERLRAQVAQLEAQLEAQRRSAALAPAPEKRAGRSRWFAVSSAFLIILACVLAPLSVTSVWASNQLSDTDQYVETVAPLADDPAVQSAIADKVTTTVLTNLDVEGLTTDALETLAEQRNMSPRLAAALPGLAVPLTNGIESFTQTQVENLVASPQFAELWDQVNRVAHEQVVKILEGNEGGAVSAQENAITLNLGPIIAQVKQRLVDLGFTLANRIPEVDQTFVLVQSESLTKAQNFYQLLNTLGSWLPIIALTLLAGGVLLAGSRRRALLKGALGVTAAMVVLGVALAVARGWYVSSTPANILTEQAAGGVFDTMVRFLRTALRATAVLGLVVALGAFITGPSTGAVGTRGRLVRGIGSLRGGAEAHGWQSGRVGTWTYAHKTALRIATVIAGGFVLMFWTRPSGWTVIGTALVVLFILAVIEFLGGRPAAQTPSETTAHTGAGQDRGA